ncbi:MAG: ATP synthase subunit C [Clostridiales bacterium]|jgi:V/A-type H+-transporting ATPase subunit K|nr:ATP synthase subunit C [Clostridiales bacterium]
MAIYLLFGLLAATVALPVLYYNLGGKTAKRGKRALVVNLVAFFAVAILTSVLIFNGNVYAAEEAASGTSDLAMMAAFLGAALVTGLCCIGTGIAVGSAATAAIGAISENEKIMGKALIFVAMAEGIAIYGLLVSFMILGRV